ncbi:hypothetical protein SAMN04487939_101933 [Lysobacter sp. yr284]|uniref:hypothetical protein n=1 Tax=Lysobacter TaxID=68 RepID=UPI00089D5090|nr:hypothetical protein [Lysobacter sp. yr284]SDY34245.1 hypothetical protein SAMN04487939_101933 [Lysobacter sp. yr284]
MGSEGTDSYNGRPPLRERSALWQIAALAAVVLAVLWPSLFAQTLSGDEFAHELRKSDRNSYSYWQVYRSDARWHCFRTPRAPFLPDRRQCVSAREVELLPGERGSAVPRYLRAGEVVLKAGRTPGAKRELL